jgi:CubicO group peptidase (beta-lactamase class C family)
LKRFFPELDSEPQGSVTIAQLLSHCSGYPAIIHLDQMGANGPESAYHLTKFVSLESEPGTAVRYSDVGYLLLGHLLEKVSGKRLDELYGREIAAPIGVRLPGFRPNGVGPVAPAGIASTSTPDGFLRPLNGIVEDENTRYLGGVSGAAGLFGNLAQVGALALEFRRAWTGDSAIFRRQTMEQVWSVTPRPAGNTWTLGWDTPSDTGSTAGRYFSLESVGHLGFVGTSLWYDRKFDVIAVVLANRVNPVRSNNKFNPYRARLHDSIMESLGVKELRPRRYS